MQLKGNRGFTIIQMLVVAAIFGLIVTVVIQALKSLEMTRAKAKEAGDLLDLREYTFRNTDCSATLSKNSQLTICQSVNCSANETQEISLYDACSSVVKGQGTKQIANFKMKALCCKANSKSIDIFIKYKWVDASGAAITAPSEALKGNKSLSDWATLNSVPASCAFATNNQEFTMTARTDPYPAGISGRSMFRYGNESAYNSDYNDSAICIHAANYQQSTGTKKQHSIKPTLGSTADTNFKKACQLTLQSAGISCLASKIDYDPVLVSTGFWSIPADNWLWSYSDTTQSYYKVSADGVYMYRWVAGSWQSVTASALASAGVSRFCNGYVWSGANDQLKCRCTEDQSLTVTAPPAPAEGCPQ